MLSAFSLTRFYVFMPVVVGIAFGQTINGTCGVPAIPPKSGQSRVKGGQDAIAGSWPWQVRLGYRSGNGVIWSCGGSILSDIYIITAAHCLENGLNRQFVVRVGDHDQWQVEASEKVHSVLRYLVHPSYGGQASNYANDIAILRLSTPIVYKAQISPACIPPAMEEPTHGASCYVTGWGKVGPNSGTPAKLQQGSVQIIGRQVCNTAQYWGNLRTSQVCAGSPTGSTDACSGDSGGPLVCKSGSSNKWILQGLVSFGPLSGCGIQKKPAVYTKVSHFHSWIKATTGNAALSA
ncbi:putative Chymotrypsin-like elastase family member 2A [Hypsibius exemplaris]|uniref:Chymotrypsin-like elastase family member 2A n=1 Tax=Hypsibius exemplaris TaxID=2072580 RepID=A0A1W0X7J2_HYPEX|nr:putative Chymotrypsin-like elastase family member 2A [Hypsibius exemplaris]